ncbi:hypothetical protein SAMN05216429_1094 [Marinobacter persicus]|uniref:Uncharacterized protein n=1 Tax=Marinobacter persicus TaxID=930118 RepID=A0A1I3W5T7_9GAMM|nr:hypothetical protein [Marinobacter persicus]GHD46663.1 hypothetical protein GCM10008110_13580 [Marinobacter persicus]SFK01846.1 hypothetical protein SAMN05216429_1094 [Marinobacter persicus]
MCKEDAPRKPDIREINYYSGKKSDGRFQVYQIRAIDIPCPPSIPYLLNGAIVCIEIADRLDYIQRQVTEAVAAWEACQHRPHKYSIETALINMKRVMDDLVMMSYCLKYERVVQDSVELEVDGWGALFSKGKPTKVGAALIDEFFKGVDRFPHVLSEIVNSFKHSYLLPEAARLFGADFPTVIGIYSHRNNYRKVIHHHNHSLGQIVIGFNDFCSTTIGNQIRFTDQEGTARYIVSKTARRPDE